MTREELGQVLNGILSDAEDLVVRSKEHPLTYDEVSLFCLGIIGCHQLNFQQDPVSCDILLLRVFQIVMTSKDMPLVANFHKTPGFLDAMFEVTFRVHGHKNVLPYTREQLRDSLVQVPGLTCPQPGVISHWDHIK